MERRGLLVLLGTVAVSSLGLAQLPWNEFYRWSTGDFCRRGQFCGHGRQRNSDTHQRYERFPYSGTDELSATRVAFWRWVTFCAAGVPSPRFHLQL